MGTAKPRLPAPPLAPGVHERLPRRQLHRAAPSGSRRPPARAGPVRSPGPRRRGAGGAPGPARAVRALQTPQRFARSGTEHPLPRAGRPRCVLHLPPPPLLPWHVPPSLVSVPCVRHGQWLLLQHSGEDRRSPLRLTNAAAYAAGSNAARGASWKQLLAPTQDICPTPCVCPAPSRKTPTKMMQFMPHKPVSALIYKEYF